jgi:hypothetical protein
MPDLPTNIRSSPEPPQDRDQEGQDNQEDEDEEEQRCPPVHHQIPLEVPLPLLTSGQPDLAHPLWVAYLIHLMQQRHGVINIATESMVSLIDNESVTVTINANGYFDCTLDLDLNLE